MSVSKYLSKTIGERVGGSLEEKQAAKYVMQRMTALGLKSSFQEFDFVGWKQFSKALLKVLTPTVRE